MDEGRAQPRQWDTIANVARGMNIRSSIPSGLLPSACNIKR